MDERCCVFLRGVNVNGIAIRMDALSEAFRLLGFSDVQTVLTTGNVVAFPPEGGAAASGLQGRIEDALRSRFDYDAHVILRSGHELRALCSAAENVSVPEDFHLYCLLTDGPDVPAELQRLFDAGPQLAGERLLPLSEDALWLVPKGSTLESPFGAKVLGSKTYKIRLSSRNLNTIRKVATAAGV